MKPPTSIKNLKYSRPSNQTRIKMLEETISKIKGKKYQDYKKELEKQLKELKSK